MNGSAGLLSTCDQTTNLYVYGTGGAGPHPTHVCDDCVFGHAITPDCYQPVANQIYNAYMCVVLAGPDHDCVLGMLA